MWRRIVLIVCIAFLWAGPGRAAQPQRLTIAVKSPALSAFWNQPTYVEGNVLLPDSYYSDPSRRYPIFYWIDGFHGHGAIPMSEEIKWQAEMRALHREFIVVSLNGMYGRVDTEFADSDNLGPWNKALTNDFIPAVERRFRAIGTPATRFIAGHSSGGWAALWQLIAHPDLFRAEWSIAPDPVDFRNFTGPNLTLDPPQNFYTDVHGNAYGIYRYGRHDDETLRDFVLYEPWATDQFDSFEAVFSPRDRDGEPMHLFNRKTGQIDSTVAAYWERYWDISALIHTNWSQWGPSLQGKIHVIVSPDDTFHLDESAVLLKEQLDALHASAEFDFPHGYSHWTIFDWHGGIFSYIVGEATTYLQNDEPTMEKQTGYR